MANITKNTNTNNINNMNNNNKEEKNMKANNIIEGIINIETAKHANKVELVKRAGTSYLKLNNVIAGAIGGSDKEQKANIKCLQFIVDNCEAGEDGRALAMQAMKLTEVMANLDGINLDDTILIDSVEYIVDTKKKLVYTEDGRKVVDMIITYPELADVELTNEAIKAILIGELNKNKVRPVARHIDTSVDEDKINIEADKKLSVIDTIKGLRALGMSAKWFYVNGVKQQMPICYNGDADLGAFTSVVKDAINHDKNYLDIILTSCKMKENELNLDEETLVIDDVNCVIDYDKKELWDEDIDHKLASLEDIEYALPREAVKVMLIERARAEIAHLNEVEAEEDEDICCGCDYEDCDNCPRW